jgi:hypothetical protein
MGYQAALVIDPDIFAVATSTSCSRATARQGDLRAPLRLEEEDLLARASCCSTAEAPALACEGLRSLFEVHDYLTGSAARAQEQDLLEDE